MGRLGEEALSAKYGFTLSDDKYDMEKDAIDENGNRVEIKILIETKAKLA